MSSMEKRLDRLEEKLDKLVDQLHELNITMAKNTESLIIHEKRTDLSEQRIASVEENMLARQIEFAQIMQNITETLGPIKSHVQLVNFVFKYVIPCVSAVCAFAWKILSLYNLK